MARPSTLTRALQVLLPAYFDLSWIVAWVIAAPALRDLQGGGGQLRAILVLSQLILWTIVFAFLTYGSWKLWRWVFVVYVLLLVLDIGVTITARLGFGVAFALNMASVVIALGLLAASTVTLVRSGPWAVKAAGVQRS